MKAVFESLKLFSVDFVSRILALVRVSVVTPLDGDKVSDAEAIAGDWGTDTDDPGEAGRSYNLARRVSRHPGYVTSNGLGSLEVGGADD